MFFKKLFIFFLETRRSSRRKIKSFVSKIKKTNDVEIYFATFFNGNEQGKTLSRPARSAAPLPLSSGTTCEARDEENDRSMRIFFRLDFFLLCVARFFFFRFRSCFEVEISFSFFFLFSWALTLVCICLRRAWISSFSWCYFQGWRRTDGRSTLLFIWFVFFLYF